MSVTPVEIQRWVSYKDPNLHPHSDAFSIFLFYSSYHISSMYPVYRQWTHNTLLLYLLYGKQTLRPKYTSKYGDKWEWRNQRFCALCVILQFTSLPAFSVNADTHTHTHTHTISVAFTVVQDVKMCAVCMLLMTICLSLIATTSCGSATNNKKESRYSECVLGTFVKLRKVTISFPMFVRLSAWKKSASTRRIFIKFDIEYFSKICRENSSFVKIWEE
jgi:hypothetical protein